MRRKNKQIAVTWRDPQTPPFDEWRRDGVLHSTDRSAKWQTDGCVWTTGDDRNGHTALGIDGDRWRRTYAPPPKPTTRGPSHVVVGGVVYDTATGEAVKLGAGPSCEPDWPSVSRRAPVRRSGWGRVEEAEGRGRIEWPGGSVSGPMDGHTLWHDGEPYEGARVGRSETTPKPLPWPAELDAIAGLGDLVEWLPAHQLGIDGHTTSYARVVVIDGWDEYIAADVRQTRCAEARIAVLTPGATKEQRRLAKIDPEELDARVTETRLAMQRSSVWVTLDDGDPPHCAVTMPPREATTGRELLYLPERVVVAVGWGARACVEIPGPQSAP